jgi:hypothetical protein
MFFRPILMSPFQNPHGCMAINMVDTSNVNLLAGHIARVLSQAGWIPRIFHRHDSILHFNPLLFESPCSWWKISCVMVKSPVFFIRFGDPPEAARWSQPNDPCHPGIHGLNTAFFLAVPIFRKVKLGSNLPDVFQDNGLNRLSYLLEIGWKFLLGWKQV